MTLPVREPRAPFDGQTAAAKLLLWTRIPWHDALYNALTDIRMYGRDAAFDVLWRLATPIALYHMELNGTKWACEPRFPVGSAEHFARAYVHALIVVDKEAQTRIVRDFYTADEEEVERAILLMASEASQAMEIIDQIADFDAAISAL